MKRIYQTFAVIIILANLSFINYQVFKTSVKINVRNELGNIEEGVAVQLFATEKDYREETNPVTDVLYTDKKGNVKFSELEGKAYFINASKGDKNNVGAGVETAPLQESKINKLTIIIE